MTTKTPNNQDKVKEWDGLITETTERIVIDYANLSGRETANRSEFRERTRKWIEKALSQAKQEGREEIVEEMIKLGKEIKDYIVEGYSTEVKLTINNKTL